MHKTILKFPREQLSSSEYVEPSFKPEMIDEIKEKNKTALKTENREVDKTAEYVIPTILEPTIEKINAGKYNRFNPGVTIGDLHPHDTLYEGDKLNAVFDFEKVSYGYPLIEEVSFSLHRFVRQHLVHTLTEKGKDVNKYDVEKARDLFLNEYLKENSLTKDEIEAIPTLIAKTNAHKALRVLSYIYGLDAHTMKRTLDTEHSELYKFGMHMREAEFFR